MSELLTDNAVYRGLLTNAVLAAGKDNKPEFHITFSIVAEVTDQGEYPVEPPVERRIYLYFTENAEKYSWAKLDALGFNGDFAAPQFSDHAVQAGVNLNCRHDTYNGKTKDKFDLADFGGGPAPASPDIIRNMAARWKARSGGKATATAPKPTNTAARPAAASSAPSQRPRPTPAAGTGMAQKSNADEVWQTLVNTCKPKNLTSDQLTAEWNKLITEAEGKLGKGEAAFTPEEWGDLKDTASIPF